MYAGVPVLTSTETSLPEVGGSAVLYAHPADIKGMSEQMSVLAGNPSKREELIQASQKQKQEFSWDKTAEKTWKCIETVIKGLAKK